jgi:hypothetical protein
MQHLHAALGITPGSPLRTFMLGYYLVIGLSIMVAAGLYVAEVDPFWAWIMLLPLATAIVVVPVVALVSRSYLAGMRDLLAGHTWARWRYSPEEWRRFAEAEWARTRREARRGPLYSLALAGIIGGVLGLLGQSLAAGLATGGIVCAAGLVTSAGIWLAGRWRYRRRDAGAGEILIGPDGSYSRGRYTAFRAFNLRLSRIEVEPGDPSTLLVVTESWSQHGAKSSQETRLPIPRAHEPEAAALAVRLRTEHAAS